MNQLNQLDQLAQPDPQHRGDTTPVGALVLVCVLAAIGAMVLAKGISWPTFAAVMTALSEGSLVAMVAVSACGFGCLALRPIAPKDADPGLKAVTGCALGLWMLSTAMLVIGSAGAGMLTPAVWWPIVGGGIILAIWQAWPTLRAFKFGARSDKWSMVLLAVAAAVGLWLAGATIPPGLASPTDSYDVLEYHLQVPREYFEAGQISELPHNCYSYYPLGVEMLFLLSMCLRNGAYAGMYAAQLTHGLFAVLAVAATLMALRRTDRTHARISSALLATCPWVIYLSSLAMVEMAELCYLMLALLWLRKWMNERRVGSAWCIGLMLGSACAVKYLSVGRVAGPVLAVMLAAAVIKRKGLAHISLAAVLTAALFAPWLVRNAVYTGNPVFPLATGVFGAGHWSAQSQQRWEDGHGPEFRPPVPEPPGWKADPEPDRRALFMGNFFAHPLTGILMVLLAVIAAAMMFSGRVDAPDWNRALLGVLVLQAAVWAIFTHGMPGRFLVPAVAPLALLAGWALTRLAYPNPDRPGETVAWKTKAAAFLFVAVVGMNLLFYLPYQKGLNRFGIGPASGDRIAATHPLYSQANALPEGSRVLAVGEARAFYFPPKTIYNTVFDANPLAEMLRERLTPREILKRLRGDGVTHLLVNWAEIWRLAATYGFPAELSAELWERSQNGRPPGLQIIDDLGAEIVFELDRPKPTTQSDSQPAANQSAEEPKPKPPTKWKPFEYPRHWPIVTVYRLPPQTPPSDSGG